jgi:hypothetical protein
MRKKALIAFRGGGGEVTRDQARELRDEAARGGLHEVAVLTTAQVAPELRENPLPGVEILDGEALSDLCCRLGVGVLRGQLQIEYVDADFFVELGEGQGG